MRGHETFWPASLLTEPAWAYAKGEERWLTFLFIPIAQTLLNGFSGKHTLIKETGLELGQWEGKGILILATALPKLRQPGLEKGNQVKSVSIQKSTLSRSPLHLLFTLDQDFLQTSPSVCVSQGEDQNKRGSVRSSQAWWNQRLCGSFSYASLHLPRTSPYCCCFFRIHVNNDGWKGTALGNTGPNQPSIQNLPTASSRPVFSWPLALI